MVICEAIMSTAFNVLLVSLTTPEEYKMAMSREIPISVHPEFRRQMTDEQGKPRIFTRSSSLPSRPKLNLVRETLNPNEFPKEKASKEDHEQTAAESPSQGTNATKRNQNNPFWKANMPAEYPKVKHGPRKQNASEGREQRRYFFTENPFIGDLEKVFEDQYNSDRRPLKLGRRNTYSAGSSRETHHSEPTIGRNFTERNKKGTSFDVPIQVEFNDEIKNFDDKEKKSSPKPHHSDPKTGRNLTARNKKGTSFEIPTHVELDEVRDCIDMEKESSLEPHQSEPTSFGKNSDNRNIQEAFFDIPIQVEFDEVKNGREIKDKDLEENKVKGENSVHDTEQTATPVLEVNTEQSEPPDVVSFDGFEDCDKGEKDRDLDQLNSESNEDTAGEGNEGKENTQKCQVEVEDGDQSQRVLSSCLPQEFTEENESKNKLLTIQSILKKAEGLERKVDAFSDSGKTKEYLILEEVLTCCLIELDGIETNRDENIRLARKTTVQQLQKTLARLEQKVSCRTVENSEY